MRGRRQREHMHIIHIHGSNMCCVRAFKALALWRERMCACQNKPIESILRAVLVLVAVCLKTWKHLQTFACRFMYYIRPLFIYFRTKHAYRKPRKECMNISRYAAAHRIIYEPRRATGSMRRWRQYLCVASVSIILCCVFLFVFCLIYLIVFFGWAKQRMFNYNYDFGFAKYMCSYYLSVRYM